MYRTRSLIVSIASVALLTAVGTATLAQEATDPAALEGVEWTLTSITTDGTTTEVPAEVDATLVLDAGEASGTSGCNRFFGSYVLDGERISFGPIGVTRMFCEGPAQDVDDAYLAAFGSVGQWAVTDDGGLDLLDDSGAPSLSFSGAMTGGSADGSGPVAIDGQDWLLRLQAVGDTQAEIPDGVIVSLRMRDGQAGGNGGCNRYSTSYVIDGQDITFAEVASTLMDCGEPASTVESAYLGNLASVASWTSDGTTLTFSSAEGDQLLQYEAAPEATIVGDWVAQGVNNGNEAVVSNLLTSNITARFAEDGTLSGFDGCNDYSTTYEIDGETISISDAIATTRKQCKLSEDATPPMEYYAALQAATTWSVTDLGDLQLRDDGGALQVDYAPAG